MECLSAITGIRIMTPLIALGPDPSERVAVPQLTEIAPELTGHGVPLANSERLMNRSPHPREHLMDGPPLSSRPTLGRCQQEELR